MSVYGSVVFGTLLLALFLLAIFMELRAIRKVLEAKPTSQDKGPPPWHQRHE